MEDLTGKQLGQYQIVGPIGEGGMAAVYKAYQPGMERYVALKILPRQYANDPKTGVEFVGRFEQEAKVIAGLQHQNILPVFDFGEADGYTYLVMPFVESGTLAELLHGQPLPLPKIRRIFSQVGEALHYAHERGLVHRDVKPSNVLIDESGDCQLTDFGIAKIVANTSGFTRTGGIVGTPSYMSPEQGRGEKVIDGRSDIYSLGVMLYEMAVGRVPFDAETPIAVIFKHISDPLPIPRDINPELPESVERVILKSLAKQPEDRYTTAGEMVRALDDSRLEAVPAEIVIETTTQPTKVAGKAPSISPKPKRFPPLAVATLVGIVVVGGLVALAMSVLRGDVSPSTTPAEPAIVEVSPEPSEPIATAEVIMAATYNPDTSLHDDFEAAPGSFFDSNRWVIPAVDYGEKCIIELSDGVAVFTNQTIDKPLDCILRTLPESVPFKDLGYIEAEFYANIDTSGVYANQVIDFETDLTGESWNAQCGLVWDGESRFGAFFLVANWDVNPDGEFYKEVLIAAETWYRFRLEVDPVSTTFHCYLDDRLIASHTPNDADKLRDAWFFRSLTSYREPSSVATFLADNVRVADGNPVYADLFTQVTSGPAPAIEILRGRPNTCMMTDTEQSTLMSFDVIYHEVGTDGYMVGKMFAPEVGTIGQVDTVTEGRNDEGGWGIYPQAYELSPNTPITLEITVYAGPDESAPMSSVSRLTYNCTTGETLSVSLERPSE